MSMISVEFLRTMWHFFTHFLFLHSLLFQIKSKTGVCHRKNLKSSSSQLSVSVHTTNESHEIYFTLKIFLFLFQKQNLMVSFIYMRTNFQKQTVWQCQKVLMSSMILTANQAMKSILQRSAKIFPRAGSTKESVIQGQKYEKLQISRDLFYELALCVVGKVATCSASFERFWLSPS